VIHARPDYNRMQDPEHKIGEDEPVFLTRAHDENFIGHVADYIGRATMRPDFDRQMVRYCAEQIIRALDWIEDHGTKQPDV
jgi:hypothetical protein